MTLRHCWPMVVYGDVKEGKYRVSLAYRSSRPAQSPRGGDASTDAHVDLDCVDPGGAWTLGAEALVYARKGL